MKKIIPVIFIIFTLVTGFTVKNKFDEVNKEIENLNTQINKKSKELDEKIKDSKVLKENLSKLSKELEEKRVIIQNNEDNIHKLNEEIKQLNNKLNNSKIGKYIGVFKATAYDDSPESQGKWVGQTATGVKPQVGVIAVDPKIIPLGTKLYIEGYGNCIAGDTGGAIKGKRLDLFFNKKSEVKKYGIKNVKVYIRN